MEPVQEVAPPPTETLTLGSLVDDIEKLHENSEKSRQKFETTESIQKCVLSLFDCVNASALDFSWRNRRGFLEFEKVWKKIFEKPPKKVTLMR